MLVIKSGTKFGASSGIEAGMTWVIKSGWSGGIFGRKSIEKLKIMILEEKDLNSINTQVWCPIIYRVSDQVTNQVSNQVWCHVGDQIWNSVDIQFEHQINKSYDS